jgi:hypothetical protein
MRLKIVLATLLLLLAAPWAATQSCSGEGFSVSEPAWNPTNNAYHVNGNKHGMEVC